MSLSLGDKVRRPNGDVGVVAYVFTDDPSHTLIAFDPKAKHADAYDTWRGFGTGCTAADVNNDKASRFAGIIKDGDLYKHDYERSKLTIVSPKIDMIGTLKEFIRNAKLTKDDRLLIEMGLENPTGEPTQQGLDAVNEIVYQEYRAKLVEHAKAMKAELDDKKKK